MERRRELVKYAGAMDRCRQLSLRMLVGVAHELYWASKLGCNAPARS